MLHAVEYIIAAAGAVWVIQYLARLPQVHRHWRPVVAALAGCVAAVALAAAVWSKHVAAALGRFATSPGLGSLAAVGAAALALYGVFRQVEARRVQDQRDEVRDAAAQYAAHFRWVCERVLGSSKLVDNAVIEFLIQDLFDRAPGAKEEAAAFALLDLQTERIQDAREVAEDLEGGTSG